MPVTLPASDLSPALAATHPSCPDQPCLAELDQRVQALGVEHRLAGAGDATAVLAAANRHAATLDAVCAQLRSAGASADQEADPVAAALLAHQAGFQAAARTVRRALLHPGGALLPLLAGNGRPRAAQLADELVDQGQGRLDRAALDCFLRAYQEHMPLGQDELRALPALVRAALLAAACAVGQRCLEVAAEQSLAAAWADRMAAAASRCAADVVLEVADLARSAPPLGGTLVAALVRRLPPRHPALGWIAARLAADDSSIAAVLEADLARQSADLVRVEAAASGLATLDRIDWDTFEETHSQIDRLLRRDPDGTYPRMDSTTRSGYRAAVAQLARGTGRTETDVAEHALALADAPRAPAAGGLDPERRHVGYYLAGAGRPALELELGVRPGLRGRLETLRLRAPLVSYLAAVAGFTILFALAAAVRASHDGIGPAMLAALCAALALGTSELAVVLADFIAAQLARPRVLPRLDCDAGIPAGARTALALYTVLDGPAIAAACDALEVQFLANRDPNLRACLLADLPDALEPQASGDAEVVEGARQAIDRLNARHAFTCHQAAPAAGTDDVTAEVRVEPFALLVRARTANERESCWMGRDRARGMLADFNAWLRGADEPLALAAGAGAGLAGVSFVITVAPGTELGRGAVRHLVATMAHPLNQARLDAAGLRVVAGYGALCPGAGVALARPAATPFQRVGAGAGQFASVAARQALFGIAPLDGTCIYDVDVARRVLDDALPPGRVLGRGLLDGGYLRCGAVADLAVGEAVPMRYSDEVAQRHRKVRAAWQAAPWIGPRVPGAQGAVPNPMAPALRWWLADQLRASLVPAALLAALLLGWFAFPGDVFWTVAVVAVLLLPVLVHGGADLFAGGMVPWPRHLARCARAAGHRLVRAALALALLPYEAWYRLDAIARALWRTAVSRRMLLEWNTPGFARSSTQLVGNWRTMAFAPSLAAFVAVALQLTNPQALLLAAPFLLVWFLAPALAWWVSLPGMHAAARPLPADGRALAALAWRRWHDIDRADAAPGLGFVPEGPASGPALLTPESMGWSLLAPLAAWDGGHLDTASLVERTRAMLATMARLPRHRGYFLHGYDGHTLAPLAPRYVPTAANGDLAAQLLTLAVGLEQAADHPLVTQGLFDALGTTLDVIAAGATPALAPLAAQLRETLVRGAGQPGADTLPGICERLGAMRAGARTLAQAAAFPGAETVPPHAGGTATDGAASDSAAGGAPPDHAQHAGGPLHPAPGGGAADAPDSLPTPDAPDAPDTPDTPDTPDSATVAHRARAAHRADAADAASGAVRPHAGTDAQPLPADTTPDTSRAAPGPANASPDELAAWCAALVRTCEAAEADLLAVAPWMGHARAFVLDARLTRIPTLRELAQLRYTCAAAADLAPAERERQGALARLVEQGSAAAARRLADLEDLARQARALADADAACLFDPEAQRLAQGYCVDEQRRDERLHYELGGAALLAHVVALARGQLPLAAWQAVARGPLAAADPLARALAPLLFLPQVAGGVAQRAAAAALARCAPDAGAASPLLLAAAGPTWWRTAGAPLNTAGGAGTLAGAALDLVALDALLHGAPMRRRFTADPHIRAALPLLALAIDEGGAGAAVPPGAQPVGVRRIDVTVTPVPEVQLLANGRFRSLVGSAGGGCAGVPDGLLTRWRGDALDDSDGCFCYVRDVLSGAFWSTTYQPTLAEPDWYEAFLEAGYVSIARADAGIVSRTAIAVVPGLDVELRRTVIRNASPAPRTLELTSFMELAERFAGGTAHVLDAGLLFHAGDAWLVHQAHLHGAVARDFSVETRRHAFLGADGRRDRPAALLRPDALGGTGGPVADPVAAVRQRVVLAPGASVTLDLVTGLAQSRADAALLAQSRADAALLARRFGDPVAVARAFAAARARAVVLDAQYGGARAHLGARLAAALLYRAKGGAGVPGALAATALVRALGFDASLPLMLVELGGADAVPLAGELLAAMRWCARMGVEAGVALWCASAGSRSALAALCGGHVRVFAPERLADAERATLRRHAQLALDDAGGAWEEQLARALVPADPARRIPVLVPAPGQPPGVDAVTLAMPPLQLSTGAGGYSADGGQYVLRLAEDRRASGGWTSALGDADCGLLVEPAGRLRVRLPGAAVSSATLAFYLRDEESGHYWSPAPWPVRGRGDYLLRHGQGSSAFDHVEGGIASTLTLCAPPGAGAVHAILRVHNGGTGVRRLSATPYLEWPGTGSAVLHHDARSGCLVLDDAGAAHAIVLASSLPGTATGARAEFIGRCRNLATPAAMLRRHLSDRCDDNAAGCAARMVPFELAAGATLELEFALVRAGRRQDDLAAAAATGGPGRAAGALEAAQAPARATFAVLQVETPDAAINLLLNGWLATQVRSALAARAGADALGLASALVLVEPALVRAELCRVDVAADLWLPIAVARYVDATGDLALFEAAPWLFERCVQALAAGTGGAVWLAWLRCDALARFAAVAGLRGAAALAEDCAGQARACALALEREAWMGDGYRATLGAQGAAASAADDALAQIWAVLSGAADPQRARQALASFERDCAMRGVTRLPAQTILWAAMAHARVRDAERALELALHVDPAWPDNAAGLHVLYAEAILGLRAQAGKASIAPRVPARWPGFTLRWKTVKTVYIVSAERGDPVGMAGDTAAVLPSGGEQQVALRL